MLRSAEKVKVFDAHLHIIDERFPLIPNQGYRPEYFSCQEYLERDDEEICERHCFRSCELYRINSSNVGHGIPLANPDYFNRMVEEWLQKGVLPSDVKILK